jgi:hypothetical protein
MSGKKKRDIGGTLALDGMNFVWAVKSEPQWNTTAGDIGLRLSVVMQDDTLNRHGKAKVWRELVLQYPFVRHQKTASRFPDKPRVDPIHLAADIRLAMAAGWEPKSRGRPFELVLEEADVAGRS